MNAPMIANTKPNIFSPILPSFWSPKLNIFFVMTLASKIKTTPSTTNIKPVNIKNIFPISFLAPYFISDIFSVLFYLGLFIAACAAASLAIGTLYGEHDT